MPLFRSIVAECQKAQGGKKELNWMIECAERARNAVTLDQWSILLSTKSCVTPEEFDSRSGKQGSAWLCVFVIKYRQIPLNKWRRRGGREGGVKTRYSAIGY